MIAASKYCDMDKFSNEYLHKVGTQFDNAIYEMQKDRFCVNAIPIPEGATNGDMIKAMFPDIKAIFPDIKIYDSKAVESIYIGISFGKYIGANIDCMRDWWDAPYKSEAEDGNK